MKNSSRTSAKGIRIKILLTTLAVLLVISGIAYQTCYQMAMMGYNARYAGLMNIAAERLAKTIKGMEMNAMNVFDEVEKHLETPETVVAALESKTSLNPEVRGYFAAFEPNYFPEKGQWYEPYVHHIDNEEFEVRQVGSVRHNYHKSDWYVRAKKEKKCFWSEPYYYYDGTNISGHYTTFVKPIYNNKGSLTCVCGADMTFEWISKELTRIDSELKSNQLLNKYYMQHLGDFYTVVIHKDGSRIAGPDGRVITITDDELLDDFAKKNAGSAEIMINGVPSMIYYGPIERVDWSIAIVVPKQNLHLSMAGLVVFLAITSIIGLTVVWLVCRRIRDDKTV